MQPCHEATAEGIAAAGHFHHARAWHSRHLQDKQACAGKADNI
jgi:hypothetical protein